MCLFALEFDGPPITHYRDIQREADFVFCNLKFIYRIWHRKSVDYAYCNISILLTLKHRLQITNNLLSLMAHRARLKSCRSMGNGGRRDSDYFFCLPSIPNINKNEKVNP